MRAAFKRLTNTDKGKLAFFLFIMLSSLFVFVLTPNLLPSTLVSIVLYFVFAPTIDAAERKGVARTSAILVVFAICGVALGFVASAITPRIVAEISAFQADSNHYNFSERLRSIEGRVLVNYPLLKKAGLMDKLVEWLQQSADKVWVFAPNLASHVFMLLLIVPFLTFVLLKDAYEIKRQLLRLVPNRQFETVYGLTSRILDEMGGFVAARIIEAVLMTGLVTVGCLVFKIPYAILLGVFAGATNAIPYIGPLIGAAPALFLAVLDPTVPNQLVCVAIIYAFANLVDIAVIFPLIVSRIVNLHPVMVVVAVVLGSQIFGIVGMVVAVPLTSIVKILIQEVYSRIYNNAEPLF